ncbi:MAG: polysaccharide export protein [Verrucomicrobia bacterium]|nr:polysaccharide export protein [Verrucomicrobiota bacterium]
MNFVTRVILFLALAAPWAGSAQNASSESSAAPPPASTATPAINAAGGTSTLTVASPQYVLRPGDVVQVKVYQEEDLTSVSRIGKEGTLVMPLLGSVKVSSNTLAEATVILRDLLAKDYLVNPQVSLNVTEFAKRRFTVLGEVQKPGTYDMPTDESVSLLQAIATAGGYTRIGNPRRITVQRTVDKNNTLLKLDAEAMAKNKQQQPFVILPDDVIIVGEKWM